MDVLGEDDVSMHEAKQIMARRQNERDLVYDQKICLEYLEKTAKLSQEKVKALQEELGKIAILKPRYIALILNTLPDTVEEVEALFAKERTNLKKEEIAQIVEIVKKFRK